MYYLILPLECKQPEKVLLLMKISFLNKYLYIYIYECLAQFTYVLNRT